MGPRAICVSRDAEVRQVVGEALAASGIDVAHHDALPAELAGVALVVVDRATRQAAGEALCGAAAPVVVVGDSLDDDGLVALMLDAPVSHLVGDPHDRDLEITSEKLVSRDLFGLEKYVAPGAAVHERLVANDQDKRVAMGEVCAWAEGVGARRPVVHRIASVVDELLMNAMLDAPRESRPTMVPGGTAVLRWASDDRLLAISVGDAYGAIRQRDVIDHVRRARVERGRPANQDEPGAGIGLYLVLANVASLIVNVEPSRRTEVICLFDIARRERRAVSGGVRSLHVFT
ncbi:MAG: hypothetical protein ACM31C_18380 [Acidobacteriota bacterium]